MGCCNHLTTGLITAAPNPMMHVNFVKGMVLGADDYRQEFAYLSNGNQWAIRELIGYGTASGLAVKLEDDGTKGPRIQVSPGAAVPPSGRMICVGAPQCGWLNDWLAKPEVGKEIADRLTESSPPASPPDTGRIDVYLTLCFRDCAVLPVPVPGEPCRSDDELMTPSRIADDYVLSLQFDPPEQTEADAIARLVAWIDQVELADALSPPTAPGDEEKSWSEALHELFGTGADEQSPPASPPVGSPPQPLVVAEDRYDEFLKYAFRIWVTEVRPTVMARRCGTDADDADDCLLLARLGVPLLRAGDSADRGWQVDGAQDVIEVDESRRPMIAPLHLVQTVLGMAVASSDEEPLSPPAGPPGEPGLPGEPGKDATIAIGTVTTLAPGSNASVANVGTASNAVFDFGIPRGENGDSGGAGSGATITIGAVSPLAAGSAPTVTNVGTATDAIFDFGIPAGDRGDPGADATVAIGGVTALPAGSQATVANSGTPSAAVLDFGIPQGADGAAGANATIAIGNVASLPPGAQPTVANVGTPSAAVLDFGIPEGQPGPGGGASLLRLHPIFVTKKTPIDPKDDIDSIVVEAPNNGRIAVILPPIADPRVETGRAYIVRARKGTAIVVPSDGDIIENIGGEFPIREGQAFLFMSRHERVGDREIREWVFMLDLLRIG